jgi:hypothetical protein
MLAFHLRNCVAHSSENLCICGNENLEFRMLNEEGSTKELESV